MGPLEFTCRVDADAAGTRLDAFLAKDLPQFSRSRIKDLILAGAASVDGRVVSEPKYRVKPAESITLATPEPEEAAPQGEDLPLTILYEDAHLIVLDKPAGMVVHPAPGNPAGTLVNALIHHCGESLSGIGGVRRPGIVHRLDKDTSGVMVVAKTETAHRGLSEQFADHGRTGPLERRYSAFVWGTPEPLRATITTRIGRDPHNRLKQAVLRTGGREAITHYRVAERFCGERWSVAHVKCRLETGRTHQIRVHLAHIGNPLIGDQVYGAGFASKTRTVPHEVSIAVKSLGRQALHAGELGFAHPVSGEVMRFSAPLPDDLEALATRLRADALEA